MWALIKKKKCKIKFKVGNIKQIRKDERNMLIQC